MLYGGDVAMSFMLSSLSPLMKARLSTQAIVASAPFCAWTPAGT